MKEQEPQFDSGLKINPLDYYDVLNGIIKKPVVSCSVKSQNHEYNRNKTPEQIKKEYYQKQKQAKILVIMAMFFVTIIAIMCMTFSLKKNNAMIMLPQNNQGNIISADTMTQMNDEGNTAIKYASALSYGILWNIKNIRHPSEMSSGFIDEFTPEGLRQYLQQSNKFSEKILVSDATDLEIVSVSGLSLRTPDGKDSYDIHLKLQQKKMIINMDLILVKDQQTGKLLIDAINIHNDHQ